MIRLKFPKKRVNLQDGLFDEISAWKMNILSHDYSIILNCGSQTLNFASFYVFVWRLDCSIWICIQCVIPIGMDRALKMTTNLQTFHWILVNFIQVFKWLCTSNLLGKTQVETPDHFLLFLRLLAVSYKTHEYEKIVEL
jgi:hypothetical protein